jgi:predicted chitinase
MSNKSQLGSVIDELQGQRKDLEAQRAAINEKIVDMLAKQTTMSPDEIVQGLIKLKRKKTVKEETNSVSRIGNVNPDFYADAVSASKPRLRKGDSAANIGSKIYAVIQQDIEEQRTRKELSKNFEEGKWEEEERQHKELMDAIKKAQQPKIPKEAQVKPKKELPPRDEKGRFVKKQPEKVAEKVTPSQKPAETPTTKPSTAKPAETPEQKPVTAKPATEAPAPPSVSRPTTSIKPSTISTATKVGVGTIVAGLTSVGITNEYTQAAVLANVKKESNFKITDENLNYSSVSRLREVFKGPTKGKTDEELKQYLKNPEGLAEFVYGNKMGNTQPGDGFKYRGRGSIQLTGKNNYAYYGKLLNIDLVNNPDLVLDPTINTKIVGLFVKTGLGKKVNSFQNQQEANRAVTQTIGGKALNLDTGYGAKLLSKVEENSKEFSGTALAAASIENKDLKTNNRGTNVLVDNTKTTIVASGGSTQQVITTATPSEKPAILGT